MEGTSYSLSSCEDVCHVSLSSQNLMTVWGHLTLASLDGTRSASSEPFHLIRNISSPEKNITVSTLTIQTVNLKPRLKGLVRYTDRSTVAQLSLLSAHFIEPRVSKPVCSDSPLAHHVYGRNQLSAPGQAFQGQNRKCFDYLKSSIFVKKITRKCKNLKRNSEKFKKFLAVHVIFLS